MSALLIRSGSLMTDGSSRQQATGAARRRAPEQPWSAQQSASGLPPAAIHHDLERGNGADALTRLALPCRTASQASNQNVALKALLDPRCYSRTKAKNPQTTDVIDKRI
jgi:hypothetical protein